MERDNYTLMKHAKAKHYVCEINLQRALILLYVKAKIMLMEAKIANYLLLLGDQHFIYCFVFLEDNSGILRCNAVFKLTHFLHKYATMGPINLN